MSPHPTHVAIISDYPLLRHGLAHVIDSAPDLERTAPVRRVGARRQEVGDADVVLLNVRAPVSETCDIISRLHEEGHRVVVVSGSTTQNDLVPSIEAGARGYLSQRTGEGELLAAVRSVASGRSYFATGFVGDRGRHKNPPRITGRERQILELVASGATDREIASKLNISEHTVHSHLDRLGSKTGFRRRADLTRLALQHGVGGEATDNG